MRTGSDGFAAKIWLNRIDITCAILSVEDIHPWPRLLFHPSVLQNKHRKDMETRQLPTESVTG